MVSLRFIIAVLSLSVAFCVSARSAPIPGLISPANLPAADPVVSGLAVTDFNTNLSTTDLPDAPDPGKAAEPMAADQAASVAGPKDAPAVTRGEPALDVPVDADGNPIPLERRQPKRILGFMPNFRSVSG